MGLITQEERHELVVEKWTDATDEVAEAMREHFDAAQPDHDDGHVRRARLDEPDPSARRHARPHGQPEGRDHRAPDQGQLHGGPDRPRVLHLDARRPQGPRRHRAAHRRLGLPHPAPGRRRAGRDHPRAGLRHEGVHRAPRPQRAGRAERQPRRPVRRRGDRDQARPRHRREGRPDRPRRDGGHLREPRRGRVGRRPLGAQVRGGHRRVPGLLRPLDGDRARPRRSATRWASSPPSRSASRARS